MAARGWETYEEVAAYLLNKFAEHFELGHFDGKQIVPGVSGTKWEIDAKGSTVDGSSFAVVECKRYTKSGVSQAITASLGWSIQDMGASAGILVSPLGLQEGAKKVAAAANIVEVKLGPNSTTTEYVMQFLDRIHVGVSDQAKVQVSETVRITVKDEDGNIVEDREIKG